MNTTNSEAIKVWMIIENSDFEPLVRFIPINKLHSSIEERLTEYNYGSLDQVMTIDLKTGEKIDNKKDWLNLQYHYLDDIDVKDGSEIVICGRFYFEENHDKEINKLCADISSQVKNNLDAIKYRILNNLIDLIHMYKPMHQINLNISNNDNSTVELILDNKLAGFLIMRNDVIKDIQVIKTMEEKGYNVTTKCIIEWIEKFWKEFNVNNRL